MTRALYAAYNGPLYQVQRISDNAIQDIGLLSTGGYANAAAQDSFCSGTTCNIIKLYDQTSNHNDLVPQFSCCTTPANALSLTINGHNAYALQITTTGGGGFGTNNAFGLHTGAALPGMPTGSQPESTYMIASGTYWNSGCCFDYGNSETNFVDTGQGHMDTIYLGNACFWGKTGEPHSGTVPCTGPGPWVGLDMEQGVFFSNGGVAGYSGEPSVPYITAMVRNDGTSNWALKAGNAQSGGLTVRFSGALAPTVACCNAALPPPPPPMNKEGGFVLGSGGDSSSLDNGVFFEGAVVAGFTSDVTDNAIQANIVSAGYGK